MALKVPASCVIGFPVEHSRSPKLHGYWLDKYRIDGAYRVEEVQPAAVDAFISDLAGHGYVGANQATGVDPGPAGGDRVRLRVKLR